VFNGVWLGFGVQPWGGLMRLFYLLTSIVLGSFFGKSFAYPRMPSYLQELRESLTIPPKESIAFRIPTLQQLTIWKQVIQGSWTGTYGELSSSLGSLNMAGECLPSRFDCQILVLRGDPKKNYVGTYLFRMNYKHNVIIEVPHPLHDLKTLDQGFDAFHVLEARALFVAGTHRNANEAESPCSILEQKPNPFRISDVAHFTQNFFHAAHTSINDLDPNAIFISLHGFGSAQTIDVDLIVSNGTDVVDQHSLANKLAHEYISIAQGFVAGSCNEAISNFPFCGTTNVQGRYTNNAEEVCYNSAVSASNRFLHIEQSQSIRLGRDEQGYPRYYKVIDAINRTLPKQSGKILPPAHRIDGVPSFRQGPNLCGPAASSMIADFYGESKWDQFTIARHLYNLPKEFNWNQYRYTFRGRLVSFFEKYLPPVMVLEGKGSNLMTMKRVLSRNKPLITRAYWNKSKTQRHYRAMIGYDDLAREVIYNESFIDDELGEIFNGSHENPTPLPGLTDLRMSYAAFLDLWNVGGSSPSLNYMIIPRFDD
jgi:hypothetical protein